MPSTILSDNGVSSGSAGLKTTAASDGALALQTTTAGGTATTAVYVDTSQNVGIGTTSPSVRLHAYAASNETMRLESSSTSFDASLRIFQNGTAITNLQGGVGVTGGGTFLATITSAPLVFGTGNSERARITSAGDFLVGRTTSSGRFCVSADTGTATGNRVALFSSTFTGGDQDYEALGLVKYANVTTGNVFLRFFINNGNAGSGLIQSNGSNTAAFASYSDARLKENIVNLPSQLDNIMALRPVEFDYIESQGGGHQIGFIAQEMQTVYADSVTEGNDGMLTIAGWDKTTARLVKAIQEQQAIITQLQADVAALKGAQP